jgi:hypothetical protein
MPRCTLLIIIEDRLLREAIAESMRLVEEYQDLLPQVLETAKSELYAIGEAARIQDRTRLPKCLGSGGPAATAAGAIHALWAKGRWTTPDTCPPGPPDTNGASDWQWAHYNSVMDARPDSHLILWDLYLRTEEGRLAA